MLKLSQNQHLANGGGCENVNKIALKAIRGIKQFNKHVINLKLVLLAIVTFLCPNIVPPCEGRIHKKLREGQFNILPI